MTTRISFPEILEISKPEIEKFRALSDEYPDPDAPDACEAFARQVTIVEGALRQAYGIAAALAKRSEELTETLSIWQAMTRFCDVALEVLNSLKDKHPYCGTPGLYDIVLDYKLAADKRRKSVEEEIECQKMKFPEGLFPETT